MTTYIVGYSMLATGDVRVEAPDTDTAKAIVTAWLKQTPPHHNLTVSTPVRLDDMPEARTQT